MAQATSKELVISVCKALADKRGKDIVALYVREKTDLCDYFVIASGSNAPQIRAMGERVEELVERDLGILPSRTEGVRDGRWAVVDYGDVIVNVFDRQSREFYSFDRHLPAESAVDISDLVEEVDKKFDLNS